MVVRWWALIEGLRKTEQSSSSLSRPFCGSPSRVISPNLVFHDSKQAGHRGERGDGTYGPEQRRGLHYQSPRGRIPHERRRVTPLVITHRLSYFYYFMNM